MSDMEGVKGCRGDNVIKMKQTGILLFVPFLMVLLIAGHGAAAAAAGAGTGASLVAHLSDSYKDDLDGMIRRRYVRVLAAFNRTHFFISNGAFYGYEYDLLKEYERFLNRGIKGLPVVFEFIPVSRDRLIHGIVEGYGDIAAAGLTVTESRLKQLDFTDPYLSGIDEVLVTHKSVPVPESVNRLSGKWMYVRESSSYYESLNALNRRLFKKRLPAVKIWRADESLETEDILEMVNSRAVARTVCDSHIAQIWSKVLPDIRVHADIKLSAGSRIAWAIRKNSPRLLANLNLFLRKHKQGTLSGNIYFNRYYRDNPWIRNPLDKNERGKYEQFRELFQKYGERYGFDWLLLMAIAYQESGLDQKKRSPSGAVGIMQVKPATAKDRNIGIHNVNTLENNVHAGVKYLAYLRDRYYGGPDIRPRDRVRFAVAAYNAGPARIRKARAVAVAMGMDPNRWFRNVELATLKSVGRETVRYVSNVNKYYLAYRLSMEMLSDRN